MAMLAAAQGHGPLLGFKLLGASAVAMAVAAGEGRSIQGDVLQSLRLPLELLQSTLSGLVRISDGPTNVRPLEEADIRKDLAKAGVYWELSPLSLSRLRFQTTLEELKELHRNRLRQSSAAFIQQAWRAHQSRKRHLAYRKNSAAQVTLAQGRLLQA